MDINTNGAFDAVYGEALQRDEVVFWEEQYVQMHDKCQELRQRVADLEQALAMVQPVVELQRQVEALEAKNQTLGLAFDNFRASQTIKRDLLVSLLDVAIARGIQLGYEDEDYRIRYELMTGHKWEDAPPAVRDGSNAESSAST